MTPVGSSATPRRHRLRGLCCTAVLVASVTAASLPTAPVSAADPVATGGEFRFFNEEDRPAWTSSDSAPIEVGLKFRPSVPGQVTGVRFYKGSELDSGEHTGTLWSSDGTQLAQVKFTNETASGWQQAQFATPVSVAAGQTYVISYHSEKGRFSATKDFFRSPLTRGQLTAPAGSNGLYHLNTATPQFPSRSTNSTNYWVDVVFRPEEHRFFDEDDKPAWTSNDTQAIEVGMKFRPSVPGQVTGVRFYKGSELDEGPHTGTLWSSDGTQLAQVKFTNETASGWQQARFATPVSVAAGQTYVISYYSPWGRFSTTTNFFESPLTRGPLTAPAGSNGLYLSAATRPQFPTRSTRSTNYWVDVVFRPDPDPVATSEHRFFDEGDEPAWTSSDSSPIEVGLKFRPSVPGQVTGVRFYKGTELDEGPHTGTLWSSDGKQLARVRFSNETASGWQQARFTTPVSVAAGQTYVISYHSPTGRFSTTTDFFESPLTREPLTAPAGSNGLYLPAPNGPQFPTRSTKSTNYWIDVMFRPADDEVAILGRTFTCDAYGWDLKPLSCSEPESDPPGKYASNRDCGFSTPIATDASGRQTSLWVFCDTPMYKRPPDGGLPKPLSDNNFQTNTAGLTRHDPADSTWSVAQKTRTAMTVHRTTDDGHSWEELIPRPEKEELGCTGYAASWPTSVVPWPRTSAKVLDTSANATKTVLVFFLDVCVDPYERVLPDGTTVVELKVTRHGTGVAVWHWSSVALDDPHQQFTAPGKEYFKGLRATVLKRGLFVDPADSAVDTEGFQQGATIDGEYLRAFRCHVKNVWAASTRPKTGCEIAQVPVSGEWPALPAGVDDEGAALENEVREGVVNDRTRVGNAANWSYMDDAWEDGAWSPIPVDHATGAGLNPSDGYDVLRTGGLDASGNYQPGSPNAHTTIVKVPGSDIWALISMEIGYHDKALVWTSRSLTGPWSAAKPFRLPPAACHEDVNHEGEKGCYAPVFHEEFSDSQQLGLTYVSAGGLHVDDPKKPRVQQMRWATIRVADLPPAP